MALSSFCRVLLCASVVQFLLAASTLAGAHDVRTENNWCGRCKMTQSDDHMPGINEKEDCCTKIQLDIESTWRQINHNECAVEGPRICSSKHYMRKPEPSNTDRCKFKFRVNESALQGLDVDVASLRFQWSSTSNVPQNVTVRLWFGERGCRSVSGNHLQRVLPVNQGCNTIYIADILNIRHMPTQLSNDNMVNFCVVFRTENEQCRRESVKPVLAISLLERASNNCRQISLSDWSSCLQRRLKNPRSDYCNTLRLASI